MVGPEPRRIVFGEKVDLSPPSRSVAKCKNVARSRLPHLVPRVLLLRISQFPVTFFSSSQFFFFLFFFFNNYAMRNFSTLSLSPYTVNIFFSSSSMNTFNILFLSSWIFFQSFLSFNYTAHIPKSMDCELTVWRSNSLQVLAISYCFLCFRFFLFPSSSSYMCQFMYI